jgi:very-short-patch-repair endonuclease
MHRDLLAPDEITTAGAVAVTTARRTAYDLACELPLTEAVVALDALSHAHKFEPAEIAELRRRHLGARGSAQLDEVIRLANRLSQSPMESRRRLVIVFDGLPAPVLQHPVGPFFLDLAYPALRLAIEYDGDAHRTQDRAMRDLDRQAYLSAHNWKVLRFTAAQVLYRPWEVAARVRYELAQAARRQNCALDELRVY